MKYGLIVYVVIAIVMFLEVGCMNDNFNQRKNLSETSQYSDPASPFTVSPGEKFIVIIASNHTTGYSWQLARPINEKVIKLVNSEYAPARNGLLGAGGKEIWTFIAVAAGETKISLKYVRPWEKEKQVDAEMTYTVIVR
jgi:predicted secreted protein